MDPDSSILILDDPHCGKVTLYEARGAFDAPYPYVNDVTAHDNELSWEDGRYSYQLRIDLLPKYAESAQKDN